MTLAETFDARWSEAAGPDASAEVEARARRFYDAFCAAEVDLDEVRAALVGLLEHLISEAGHTEADHAAVDAFVCLLSAERNDLNDRLPATYRELIDAVSLDLLEGFHDPELAEMFSATTGALLARARALAGEPIDPQVN